MVGFAIAITAPMARTVCAQMQRDRSDGAYWYEKGIEYSKQFSVEEMNELARYLSQPQETTPAWVVNLVERAQPMLEHVRRGGQRRYATLGTDLRSVDGSGQTSFHRESAVFANLLWAEAQVRSADGDFKAAADSVAAMYNLTGHFANDSAAGGSIALNMYRQAEQAIDQFMNQGDPDPVAIGIMLESVHRLNGPDPLRFFEAEVETRGVVLEDFRNAIGDESKMALLKRYQPLEGVTVTEEAIDYAQGFLEAAAEIYAMPDRDQAKRLMQEMVEQAKNDPRAGMLWEIDSFVSKLNSVERMKARIDRREQSLRKKLNGGDIRNAAVLYRTAVASFESERDQFWKDVKGDQQTGAGLDGRPYDPASVDDALARIAGALALLDEASRIEFCDFGENVALYFLPDYAVGLGELERVIALRAQRDFETDHHVRASESLALMLRIARHLAVDRNMLGPMVAHDSARQVEMLASKWYADAAPTILATTEGMPSHTAFDADDPFGYVRSEVETRHRVAQRFAGVNASADKSRAARAHVDAWSHDTLLAVVMYLDTGARGQTLADAEWRDLLPRVGAFVHEDHVRALWAAFTVEAFSAWAREDASDVSEPLAADGLSDFSSMLGASKEDWGRIESLLPKRAETELGQPGAPDAN